LKKVLIITYYWPPSGGGGVQRWLKFVKYLKQFGWEPIVYTPGNPEAPSLDISLESEVPKGTKVVTTNIWEPYSLYKMFIGKKKTQRINTGFLSESKKPKFTDNISVLIRGNFFIPDARKFWIKPSVRFLKDYLRKNPVDAIVSTGPPHSMHLIALGVKKLGIPWVADFRDPWTNIDFYSKLMLSKFADRKHHRQELSVIKNADKLTTVSWSWAEDFRNLGAKNINVITNGFDPDDFDSFKKTNSEKFTICHLGSMNKDRNPSSFWKALGDVSNSIEGFKDNLKIILLGSTDHQVFEDIESSGLTNLVDHINYLPHKEALEKVGESTILLLPLNDTPNVSGIIPGKIFEYLALKIPILCIGPKTGDSARIIRETNSGETVGFNSKDEMLKIITNYYREYEQTKGVKSESHNYDVYSRKELTRRMAETLNSLILK